MAINDRTHLYECERCHAPLSPGNGGFYLGLLLCDSCRSVVQRIDENGEFTFIGFGMPIGGGS